MRSLKVVATVLDLVLSLQKLWTMEGNHLENCFCFSSSPKPLIMELSLHSAALPHSPPVRDWSVGVRARKHKWMSWIMGPEKKKKKIHLMTDEISHFQLQKKMWNLNKMQRKQRTTCHRNGLSTFPHLCDKAINTGISYSLCNANLKGNVFSRDGKKALLEWTGSITPNED